MHDRGSSIYSEQRSYSSCLIRDTGAWKFSLLIHLSSNSPSNVRRECVQKLQVYFLIVSEPRHLEACLLWSSLHVSSI